MNSKLSIRLASLLPLLVICGSLRFAASYIIVEPDRSDQILINSFPDNKQLESNALTVDSSLASDKSRENRTFDVNQTVSSLWLKQSPIPTQRNVNQRTKSCHSCNKVKKSFDPEDEYIQRLEYIKHQILSKLGLSEAPKLLQKNFDSSNYLQLLEASSLALTIDQTPEPVKEVEPKESDKVFIFPTIRRLNIPQFNISVVKNSHHLIKKITLYVKQKSSEIDSDIDNNIDKELAIISTAVPINGVLTRFQDISNMRVLGIVDPQNDKSMDKQSSNWLQYDLTQILQPEVLKANKLVSFDSESFDMKDSFITIEHFNHNLMRSKRSIDCSGNTTSCCRESFYVNFTTIGWDNWILQPPGYNANYCKGKCDISNARYHHTTVIGKYPAISMCCSPREMSHISLIYLDDDNNVFQKNLANMVVESCDCA